MTVLTIPKSVLHALVTLVGYPPVLQPLLTRRLEDRAMLVGR